MAGTFPDDENGRVLRRMQENGDDLTRTRDLDFTVVFPTKLFAEAFADHFKRLGYSVSVEETKTVPELPWDVVVTRNMIPSHNEICEFEDTLGLRRTFGRTQRWVGRFHSAYNSLRPSWLE